MLCGQVYNEACWVCACVCAREKEGKETDKEGRVCACVCTDLKGRVGGWR